MLVEEVGEAGGHGGVVGAVLPGREVDGQGEGLQRPAQASVGGDAAADDDRARIDALGGAAELFNEDVNAGGLKGGGNVGTLLVGE